MNADPGSFRDRSNRIYTDDTRVLRGISSEVLECWSELKNQPFYQKLEASSEVVGTTLADPAQLPDPWPAAMVHERIPFISYPYEWTFGMLKDAAILHLGLLEKAFSNNWMLKDASAYNVQWRGSEPTFIDIPSFEPHQAGNAWVGYRQFCMMFLIPLMLQAYRGIDYRPLLRSNLDGIDPATADKILKGFSRLRRGVFSNVFLHSRMQSRSAKIDLNEATQLKEGTQREVRVSSRIKHTLAMILGTIQGLTRTVASLNLPNTSSTWGNYDSSHSYNESSLSAKEAFVRNCVSKTQHSLVWDLGCNTGNYSLICSQHSDYVVAIDGDASAVEKLYQRVKASKSKNIIPLVMDLSNMSPDQGWRGSERRSLEGRGLPSMVVCLALLHHMVISANIPLQDYLNWLRTLNAEVIIEFVGLGDEMSKMLLRNRVNQYGDLTKENFERCVQSSFEIVETLPLKGGDRHIYYLRPI
ncbi:MAG: hypothetical protein ACI9DC_000754 [Gammaproteobacteria bacterium]|jgi:hypothetical protein